jgi:WD40 repeat protein
LNSKEIITASDDCTLKFWNSDTLIIEHQIMTETITCITNTGSKKEIIVAGCHSGNLILINAST